MRIKDWYDILSAMLCYVTAPIMYIGNNLLQYDGKFWWAHKYTNYWCC